jgi:hypothetical protein
MQWHLACWEDSAEVFNTSLIQVNKLAEEWKPEDVAVLRPLLQVGTARGELWCASLQFEAVGPEILRV